MLVEFYRNDPVKSETPGHKSVWASTFAPLLVSLRIRFHPCTPPPFTYRVPVTILAFVSSCFLYDKNKFYWERYYSLWKLVREQETVIFLTWWNLASILAAQENSVWLVVSSTIRRINKKNLIDGSYMMWKISIHDYNEITRSMLQTMDICSSWDWSCQED